MINITTRISLSRRSKHLINGLFRKSYGVFNAESWKDIDSSVKNELSKKLLYNQKNKCVYCERQLATNAPEIDHFAHKGSYPQFTFITTNLFYSCRFCNSPNRKGQKPTITTLDRYYYRCTFLIVHPFFDNPDLEIFYNDVDRINIDWNSCTKLGKDTINFFGYHDIFYTSIRSQNHILNIFSPHTNAQEKELIQLSVSYRKK